MAASKPKVASIRHADKRMKRGRATTRKAPCRTIRLHTHTYRLLLKMARICRVLYGETMDDMIYRWARKEYSRLLKSHGTKAVREAAGDPVELDESGGRFAGPPAKSGGWNG